MNEQKALLVVDEIKSLCARYGLWYSLTESRKPTLRTVELSLSIKVDQYDGCKGIGHHVKKQ